MIIPVRNQSSARALIAVLPPEKDGKGRVIVPVADMQSNLRRLFADQDMATFTGGEMFIDQAPDGLDYRPYLKYTGYIDDEGNKLVGLDVLPCEQYGQVTITRFEGIVDVRVAVHEHINVLVIERRPQNFLEEQQRSLLRALNTKATELGGKKPLKVGTILSDGSRVKAIEADAIVFTVGGKKGRLKADFNDAAQEV